jgi:hypothetical protein
MGKKRTNGGKLPKKLGAPDHFSGFKMAFLSSRADSYQLALDLNTVGAFYDKITLDFVAKYGQEEPFNKEFAEDPPDPEDDDDDADRVELSKEEAAANAVLFKKLRTVGDHRGDSPNTILIYVLETKPVV